MDEHGSRRGLFVTFEGPEGAGKSTQVHQLAKRLEGQGVQPVLTREPGGTPFATSLRNVLLDPGSVRPSARAELLLILAARADHVEKVIQPSLAQGRMVLCDRFFDSTLAYQGAGSRLDREALELLNHYAAGGLTPDLTFLIRIPADEGLRRLASTERDRFEGEDLEFHRAVTECYDRLAEEYPDRIEVIDGTRSPEEIGEDVFQSLWNAFPTFERG